MVRQSLRALLSACIDYAGTFPPAALPLEQSQRNYREFADGPDAWLSGRFVCRADELATLCRSVEFSSWDLPLAVVATEPVAPAFEHLQHDIDRLVPCRGRRVGGPRIEVLEFKAPSSSADRLTQFIHEVLERLRAADLGSVRLMIEVRPDDVPGTAALLEAMSPLGTEQFGVKIRTGGVPRDRWPSVSQIAGFIDICRESGRRWKATAGLHDPFSHFDSEQQVWQYGFCNMLSAASLSWNCGLDRSQIQQVLTDTRDAFSFSDDALRWRAFQATTQQISAARTQAMISFGSCSFQEPLEGLRQAGLM